MEPIYFVTEGTLYTQSGEFPAKMTTLMAKGVDTMAEVQLPIGTKKYLLPTQADLLYDDLQKIRFKQDALNHDGPTECQAPDACPL